jgi:hypothetical protein
MNLYHFTTSFHAQIGIVPYTKPEYDKGYSDNHEYIMNSLSYL